MAIAFNPYNRSRGHCPQELIPQAEKLMRYLRRHVPKEKLIQEMGIGKSTPDRWYHQGCIPGREIVTRLLARYAQELEKFEVNNNS